MAGGGGGVGRKERETVKHTNVTTDETQYNSKKTERGVGGHMRNRTEHIPVT
jgi:hypothetical protein